MILRNRLFSEGMAQAEKGYLGFNALREEFPRLQFQHADHQNLIYEIGDGFLTGLDRLRTFPKSNPEFGFKQR